jgi:hypothetical protein
MAHFIISYDLHNERHYQPVWDKLEGWKATRLLESLWVATLNNTATEVREALKAVADSDDSIAVVELKTGSGWSTWNGRAAGVEWLRRNIAS